MLFRGYDPAVFNDEDGCSYIYVQNKAYELNEDMISLKNEDPTIMELDYIPGKYEAAYMIKRKGLYYFSITRAWNNLIYSTGESPTGPFTFRAEIMKPYGGTTITPL
jgi:hypothetical protein